MKAILGTRSLVFWSMHDEPKEHEWVHEQCALTFVGFTYCLDNRKVQDFRVAHSMPVLQIG
jgi:hypothetical protein